MVELILSGLALSIAIVAVICCYLLLKKLLKIQQTNNVLLKELLKSRDSQKKRIAELTTSNINLGGTLKGVATELQQTKRQQNEIKEELSTQEVQDPDSRFYTRAVKLVELGADLTEVMRECELPRAEAELLINLHRK